MDAALISPGLTCYEYGLNANPQSLPIELHTLQMLCSVSEILFSEGEGLSNRTGLVCL